MARDAGCLVERACRRIPRDHGDKEPLEGVHIRHGVKAPEVVKSMGATARMEGGRQAFVGPQVGRTSVHCSMQHVRLLCKTLRDDQNTSSCMTEAERRDRPDNAMLVDKDVQQYNELGLIGRTPHCGRVTAERAVAQHSYPKPYREGSG